MRIGAGAMDREIDIRDVTALVDEIGSPIELTDANVGQFPLLAHVWAKYQPMDSDETKVGDQIRAQQKVAFWIYHRDDIAPGTHVIEYGGKLFDIKDVQEVGRREGLKLICLRRDANAA